MCAKHSNILPDFKALFLYVIDRKNQFDFQIFFLIYNAKNESLQMKIWAVTFNQKQKNED